MREVSCSLSSLPSVSQHKSYSPVRSAPQSPLRNKGNAIVCGAKAESLQIQRPCNAVGRHGNTNSPKRRVSIAASGWLAGATAAAFLTAGCLMMPGKYFSAAARVTLSEAGDTLAGVPRVVDADTLVVNNEKVRLYGVDAPETKQSCMDSKGQPYLCGETATAALKQKLGSASIACQVKTKDLYQRNVSSCTLPDTGDIGDWLVKNGYAVAYREYSQDYVKDEEQAKRDHKGIWQGEFQNPGQWRREKKQRGSSSPSSSPKGALAALPKALREKKDAIQQPGCNIKGNISAQGTRIYHVPGGRYYESVKIEPSKGEKFFCSESDAEQDGFRRSKE